MTQEELPAIIKSVHDNAVKHGWHNEPKPKEHWAMMVITEISELVEADRKCRHTDEIGIDLISLADNDEDFKHYFELWAKDRVEDEMADICIRIFDMAAELGYDLDIEGYDYDIPASITDGPMTVFAYGLCQELIVNEDFLAEDGIPSALGDLFAYARAKNIDLDWHIKQKMKYNELRPYHHGGKKY